MKYAHKSIDRVHCTSVIDEILRNGRGKRLKSRWNQVYIILLSLTVCILQSAATQ